MIKDTIQSVNWKVVFWLLVFVSGLAMLGYAGTMETETVHEYEIKAEQVEDASSIENATPLSELPQDEQNALHEAYKRSDHFFGEAHVTIQSDERLDVRGSWHVVSIDGVYMLVSFEHVGTEAVAKNDDAFIASFFFGIVFVLISVAVLGEYAFIIS